MKKIALLTFLFVTCISYLSHAKVVFLPTAEESICTNGSSSNDERCSDAGYTYTSCAGALVDPCPYNHNQYRTCCPAGYIYTIEECGARPRSADNCHGYYKCGDLNAYPSATDPTVDQSNSNIRPNLLGGTVAP